VAGYT
jgi:hypothetical protein